MPRLPTGIPGFDAMVQGGLPVGSSVVLQGPPGQEKLRFALTFLAEGLKSGGSGLVVTASQSPDAVIAELRELGVNLESVTNESRLRVIDWYSWSEETVQDTEERGIVIRSSIDLTNLGVALSRAIAGLTGGGSRRAVIELLSPATSSYEVTQVYACAQSAKRKFDRHQFASLVLVEKEMHSGAQLTTLHQPFDGVIEIERTRSGDRIVRKIGVLHLKDTAPDLTFRVLEISEAGMRVVADTPKPASSEAAARGSVLESQDERAQRLRLILQIATERLKLNPRDADALFAMAAAQATLDDAKGGLETLDRLAALDSAYPGLWVLKTKLHAKLGQADLARQSRMRAQQSEPEAAKAIDATVPCPMCESPVALDATSCANCGVKFTPTRSMEDELDDLGHAAIQEMVQEELGPVKGPEKALDKPDVRAPKPETVRDVPPAKKPIEKTPSKRGLTNGLALGRRGAAKAGRTNGLRGRTNGLRGRTNGLTNGLGRTNGLTNGLGRTNGLTNGLGRTNGLTNGLGRTNGLTNGLGRTNGLTNGLGRTNGLTNGLGGFRSKGFRPAGVRRMMQNAGWKLYLIPLVSAALLLAPLFFVPDYRGPAYPIRIDGQFGDWTSQPTEAMGPRAALNPNIDVVRFGMVNNLGPYAFFVQVAGTALAGGGPSPGTMDTVRIFVDIDASAATGYRIDGLGADRMIDVSGHNATVLSSTLWEFDSNRNQQDWSGWIKGTATPAAASGSRIETEAQWLAGPSASIPVIATVHTVSWDAQTDTGDFPLSPGLGILSAVADPQAPDVIAGNSVTLLRLVLVARSQSVTLNSVHVEIAGTAPANASSLLQLTDGTNVLAQVAPTSRDVTFSFAPRQLAVGGSTTLTVVGDFASTTGETFGVRLPAVHPFGLGATVVSLRENPGARMLGYLGFVPSTPRVDGAFDEWTALSPDTTNDVGPRSNPNIDLGRYGAQRNGTSTFLYTDVTGRLFLGTPVPAHSQPVPVQSQGPADTDRDGVPDAIDPFPFDFNNDGIPDAQANGDYDGDGIVDYGFPGGTDYWLNTTIPSTFPAPYAGRSVSVYVGPDNRPPVLGDDVIRIFLDIDNTTFSGYSIGGIGADRLVEIRGKDGTVTQSALLAFTGSFPGQWAWTPLAPVTVALGYHAVELSVPLNASKLYVESGDFWESVDSTTAVPALVSRISSFRVAPASAPLVVPWTEAEPQATAVQLDPSANSPTTVYNQQRKVVRAGDVPGRPACDATNSDGCWYVVFYDRVVESTTAPSTETITTGTSCGGSFPAGIQTSDNFYRCYRETNLPGSGGSAAYQAVGILAASTGADVTPGLPTYQPNDIFLLLGWVRDQDDTVTVSGWTAIPGTPFDRGTTSRYWLFWRRAASSSETAPLFDKSGATGDTYAWIIDYRGAVTTGNPWQAVGTPATGTSDPASIPAISTTTDNALVVVAVGGEDNNNAAITTTSTDPASYTEHYVDSMTGSDGALTFSEQLGPPPGATAALSVDWDVGPPVGWGGMALALTPPPNYRMSVKYDFTGVPSGNAYTLRVEGFHTPGEPILVQVVDSTETTWTTRMTLTATSDDNVDQTYTLTTDEYDAGSPNIRFVGALETGDTAQTDFSVDRVSIDTNTWDRIVLMRSLDTSGSTWGAQVVLASGRSGDSPLVLTRDSADPSIAMDSSGYLHLVWVSASAAGDQSTLNLVRYTRTTVAYPTQSQLATGGNWQAVTSVDDTSPGYMPTISTDTGGYPHIAWSQSKTVAPEGAGVAYRSNSGTDGVNSLKTRSWDGSAWGPEVEQPNAGSPVRMVRSARSPIDPDTSIVVTQGDDGWLDAYVCTPSCTMTSDVGKAGTVYFHPFDVAFEQSSGDALLAWGGSDGDNTHDIGYMTYVSGAWSAVQWYDDTTNMIANVYGLVVLAPKKGSDQIGLVGGDINQLDITALIWDGSAFTNFVEVNTNSNQPGYENAAIAWESNSGHLVVVSADASSTTCRYMVYTTNWQPASTFTCGGANRIRVMTLKANPVSTANDMVLSVSDLGAELSTVYWTGSAWNARVSQDPGLDGIDTRSVDFAWEATRSQGLLVYATTAGQLDSKKFTAPSTWTSLPSVGAGANIHRWVQARTNPNPAGAVKILGDGWENTANDPGAWSWDGSTLTMISTTAFTADTGSNTVREAYDLDYRPVIGGYVYYKNQAGGGWKATVSWGVTYTGLSVDVSPQNNYVSLARYSAQSPGTGETQYTVCTDLLNTRCDAPSEFTKRDGTSGFDTIAVGVETGSYPSLATTWDPNADLWVTYAKDVDGTTRAIYAARLDYPIGGWQAPEAVDWLTGTLFTRPSIGVDKDNVAHVLYVATSGPQLYYKSRPGGVWDSRTAIDTSSDHPSIVVRAPNDPTYGTTCAAVYWKPAMSETQFFYIPEFETIVGPTIGTLVLVLFLGRRVRLRGKGRAPS